MSGGRPAGEPVLPGGAQGLDEAFAVSLLPGRDQRGHKGTFGTLLAVCGSLDHVGAGLLAGSAALRAGVGLATLCVPASLQPVVAGRVPELMTLGLPERAPYMVDPDAAASAIVERRHTALLVGPGLLPGRATRALVRHLLAPPAARAGREAASSSLRGAADRAGPDPEADPQPEPAILLDAQALNELAEVPRWWTQRRSACVVTPHPGEFARLEGRPVLDDDGERAARAGEAAVRWGLVVVLKGARTVVAGPEGRLAVAAFENPALGTGGTGDVLAGCIASLLAQGLAPFEAACLGVYVHGMAGEHVRERLGDAGALAGDLLPELPRVRRHLAARAERTAHGRRLGFALPAADEAGR